MRTELDSKLVAALALAALTFGGCAGKGSPTGPMASAQPSATPSPTTPSLPPEDAVLAAREIDYNAALRTAAIKLVGDLPTMSEMMAVRDQATYEAQIDKYLADPRLARQLRSYYRDMFKMGGSLSVVDGANTVAVSLDTAPTFAAELAIKDRSMNDLFTAAENTCPTLDAAAGTFADASCAPAAGLTPAGVLTDPGAMAQFYSNMAFRRVRWVQETFVCTKFPAEYSATPKVMGGGQYLSPWPFESIAGKDNGGQVDFHDTATVICANCHATLNHLAPSFANFDVLGVFNPSIQVKTPVTGTPNTVLSDWLPAGQKLAWRYQKDLGDAATPAVSLVELGKAMAVDPDVAECQVARAWNWAMSKTDIVNDLQLVPDTTIATLRTQFTSGGYKMKPLLRSIFTSDDFVKF